MANRISPAQLTALLALQNRGQGPNVDPNQHPVISGLDTLAQIIQSVQPQASTQYGPGNPSVVGEALMGLSKGWQGGRTQQNRQMFLKGVQAITASPKSPDEKINDLQNLVAQHGQDYGFGVNDIVKQYGDMANRNALSQVYGYDENGNLVLKGAVPKGSKVPDIVAQEKFNSEQKTKEEAAQKQADMVMGSAQATLNTISEIRKGLKYFGAAGDLPPWPAEYSKKNWLANVNRLKDKLVVDLMINLKSASKTGSTGFGQLSEKEGQRLENAATALQKGLKEEDASRYLTEIEDAAKKIIGGNRGGQQGKLAIFNSEQDIPEGFKGPAIIGGRRAMIK